MLVRISEIARRSSGPRLRGDPPERPPIRRDVGRHHARAGQPADHRERRRPGHRRSPRIRSWVAGRAAWSVQLGEDHFVGRAPTAVAADPGWDHDHGTDVTFSVLPTDASWIPTVIADAVHHYPVTVSVNGRRPEQSDFLKDAVRTETWRGLRVGVFHSTRPHLGDPRHQLPRAARGLPDLPQVHALPGADADAPRTWWTLADVADCPDLETETRPREAAGPPRPPAGHPGRRPERRRRRPARAVASHRQPADPGLPPGPRSASS